MHSTRELTSQLFAIEEAGRPVNSFVELCPGFTAHDRLGVVVREPLAATRCSAFIMAAVTAFYDQQRFSGEEFFIYPDYFVFHAGCNAADYSMFDIWPQHKCLPIDDDPEAITRAINDRGVTILLLDQPHPNPTPERAALLQQYTRNSALSRVTYAFTRIPAAPADAIKVRSNAVVERYAESVVTQSAGLSREEREAARGHRVATGVSEFVTESYRRISVGDALDSL